jgi:hypothetical protein
MPGHPRAHGQGGRRGGPPAPGTRNGCRPRMMSALPTDLHEPTKLQVCLDEGLE